MPLEYYYNKEFINILINYIDEHKLYSVYKLNINSKYTINYILDILISLSKNNDNNKYTLPANIISYLKFSQYSLYSKFSIKQFIKNQIIKTNNDNFLKTYIIIGQDNPNIIKELTIII
jgi:hypothetical protein